MIYLIKSNNYLKIGYTKNIINRMQHYRTHNPEYQLLAYRGGNIQAEKLLHVLLSNYFLDTTEWMRYDNFILELFSSIVLPEDYLLESESNKVFFIEDSSEEIIETTILSKIFNIKSITALKVFLWLNNNKDDNICYLPTDTRNKLLQQLNISNNMLTNALKALKDSNLIKGEKGTFTIIS